jgi:hypothetical protein
MLSFRLMMEEDFMITESRQITFSPETLVEAILLHFKTMKQPFPDGDVVNVNLGKSGEIKITLTVRLAASKKLQHISIRPEVAGAAMMAYCKRRGIPVPRRGIKSLVVSGDSLSLSISTGGRPTSLFEVVDP